MNLADEIQARQMEQASRVAKFTTKSTGLAIKYMLQRTLENLKMKPKKERGGLTKIEELQYSGSEIKIIDLQKSDYKEFAWQAVKFGMPYAIADENKTQVAVLYKGNDISRMERVLGKVLEKAKDEMRPVNKLKDVYKEQVKGISRVIEKLKEKDKGIER